MSSSKCSACGKEFSSRTRRDTHSRICGKKWEAEFKNGHVTITGQSNGQIICLCDHWACRKIYASVDGFTSHLLNAKNANWNTVVSVSDYNNVLAVIISYILFHRLQIMYVIK